MAPIISVVVTCYNQEKYIKKCLDGILMQKNCPSFEIIVGDDCSTDGTNKIIQDYANKYPNIHVLDRKHNMGMLHNLKDCFEHCNGEYIAICEGDDYWTDPEKLKKQYNALSADDNAYLCFSNLKILENGKYHLRIKHSKQIGNHLNISQLLQENYISNFSCCMYKKTALNFIPNHYWKNNLNADYIFHLYILDASAYAIFLPEPMSVYRILQNSISHKDTYPMNLIKLMRMMEIFNAHTKSKYQSNIDDFMKKYIYALYGCQTTQYINYKRTLGISFPFRAKRIMFGFGIRNK